MTTSGTVGTTTIDTAKVLEHAVRRAGLPAASQTPEIVEIAKDNLFLILSKLANRGVALWCTDKVILGTSLSKPSYDLPLGTINIRNVNLRYSNRETGTVASSAGGTAANLTDGDCTTACTQTVANGDFTFLFSQDTSVISVGLLPQGAQTLTLLLETSSDGVTWATASTLVSSVYLHNTWVWVDIAVPVSVLYFRVRETGGGTMSMYEVYLSSLNTEIPCTAISRDDYVSFPNKFVSGRPLNYWYNRTVTPSLNVWPVADSNFYQLVVWRQRSVQDVGTLTQQLELPDRWFETIIWQLAHRIAVEAPGTEAGRIMLCKQHADEYQGEAEGGESDGSPVIFSPNIRSYTA